MKSVLCDVNFFLDIFMKRRPFYLPASELFVKIENEEVEGYICSLTFPILFYLLSKEIGRAQAAKILEKIRIVFKVAAVDEKVIDLSLASNFEDFEDAVQYYSAMKTGVTCLISRDKNDFADKKIPVLTPEEFVAIKG
ncbi:MAG: type II toxin-antitoxin system VapC family toxin [Dissulfurispiraceae bacterium]